jgi:hypothetical protein
MIGFTTSPTEDCYAHGQAVGIILTATIRAMSDTLGSPDPDEVLLLAEVVRESLWDRLGVSETDYDAVDAGMRTECAAYAAAKSVRAAA